MAHIYIQDETKELLEEISKADQRTQDGEISFLLKQRKLAIHSQECDCKYTHSGEACQDENL